MDMPECKSCGQAFTQWAEYCPNCAQPMEGYSRPAGFWIRVGGSIIDNLVFFPLMILAFWNMLSLKSSVVLVLVSLPGFIYKPFMESFCGATLGKMSCRIKVIDKNGKKLSLFYAYVRSFPFLMAAVVSLAGQLVLFSSPEFQSVTSWVELGQARQPSFWDAVGSIVNLLVLIDCLVVAFTFRKRALHDMLAESFCVYREP